MRSLLLILLFLCPACWQSSSVSKPNVLFISVDDLNDWIGCLKGHPQIKTPNIDRLAARGTLFRRAYCPAPICNPSRVSLMTGIRPSTSGIYFNQEPMRHAMPEVHTIPEYFRQHGYTAFGAGKIFHNPFPDPESWDFYYPSKKKQKPKDIGPAGLKFKGIARKELYNGITHNRGMDWGPTSGDETELADYEIVSWVNEQLQKDYDRPFFLAAGIYRPHIPWYLPQKYFDMHPPNQVQMPVIKEDDLNDVAPFAQEISRAQDTEFLLERAQKKEEAVGAYLACVSFVDQMVGRLLDALDQSPHADNTIIVLFSDHGWHLGEKKHWRKSTLWEEATRVPLIVVAPHHGQNQQTCDQPVNLVDLFPTLTDLCGLPPSEQCEGQSLFGLMNDPNLIENDQERVSITTYGRHNHAVRSADWRYIRYADGSEELYDHRRDPNEWHNLAHQAGYEKRIKELAAYLPSFNAPHTKSRFGEVITMDYYQKQFEAMREEIHGDDSAGR